MNKMMEFVFIDYVYSSHHALKRQESEKVELEKQ